MTQALQTQSLFFTGFSLMNLVLIIVEVLVLFLVTSVAIPQRWPLRVLVPTAVRRSGMAVCTWTA